MLTKRIEMMPFLSKGSKKLKEFKRHPVMMWVQQSSNKKKRGVREPSYVWEHFTKVTIDGELKAKCNHCRAKLVASSNNGTSHLDRHLKKCKGKGVPSVSNSLQKTLSVTRKDE